MHWLERRAEPKCDHHPTLQHREFQVVGAINVQVFAGEPHSDEPQLSHAHPPTRDVQYWVHVRANGVLRKLQRAALLPN